MGLLNLPAPLFGLIDVALAAVLPPLLRLVVWAAIAGAGTLLLYRLLSPQQAIAEAKQAARQARQRLQQFDGELDEARPLIAAQFRTAFRHLGLVLIPSLVAALPLIALLSWLETDYSRALPSPDQPPAVRVTPETVLPEWVNESDAPRLRLRDGQSELADISITKAVPRVEKRQWWNWLIANPLGYLPGDGLIERVEIDLPELSYLPFGPHWMRSWLAIFMPSMVLISLLTYRWARIE